MSDGSMTLLTFFFSVLSLCSMTGKMMNGKRGCLINANCMTVVQIKGNQSPVTIRPYMSVQCILQKSLYVALACFRNAY